MKANFQFEKITRQFVYLPHRGCHLLYAQGFQSRRVSLLYAFVGMAAIID